MIVVPCLRAQSTRLDQTEILGRLAEGNSPSYVAHLVKVRGLRFSPTEDFVYRVKLAGGDGILVEHLSSKDSEPSVISSADQDVPVRRLAKCAELIHSGAIESAESECRAAIEENPKSPWPPLVVASLMRPEVFRPATTMSPEAAQKARTELLERAATLGPDLAAVHRGLASIPNLSQAGAENQKAMALDPDRLEASEESNLWDFSRYFGLDGETDGSNPPAATDASITLPPEFLRIAKIEPDLATNHFVAGFMYWRVSNFEKARQEFTEAMQLEPGASKAHLLLGGLDFYLRDEESGLAELRESMRIAPAGTPEHMAFAAALERLGRTSEAIDELRATIGMHPSVKEPSDALIELYLKQKDRKAAIAEVRRYLDVVSSAFADQGKFVEVHIESIRQLIGLLLDDHQLEAAGQQYQFVLRYQPNDPAIRNDYGVVLLQMQRIDEALGQFNEVLRINPRFASAHHNIGLCLAAKKNLDGAVREFRQTLELNPDEHNTQVLLGIALGQQGDVAGAKEQLQQAIAKDPTDADAHLGAGLAYEQMKDPSAAIAELKKTLELKPDSAPAANDLAWIYATADDLKLRDPAQALVLARQAVANSPGPNAAFIDTLAEALLINGQASEALSYELQAARLDPDNPEFKTRLPRFQAAVQSHVVAKK